jgi:hypothetical protein
MEGKQFINFRLEPNIVVGKIFWSELLQISVPFASDCHFLPERFCTLKFESDFYSRQGH